MKTRFSFEVQYPAPTEAAGKPAAPHDTVMDTLESSLKTLLQAQDKAATVTVSDSHKGNDNKLVELVSTLQDEQLEKLLADFSAQHGLTINALE